MSITQKRRSPKSPARTRRKAIAKDAPSAPAPTAIRPMLATLAEKAFDRAGWLFEIKWDGYRAIAELNGEKVRLYSRNHKSLADQFPPVVEALRALNRNAVLDGEIVALDESGRSHFQLLQNYRKTGRGQIAYMVFDLLLLDGRDLRQLPLTRRKEILKDLMADSARIRISEHVLERGIEFFRAAAGQALEGVIAKNASSPYREGVRSLDWLKIKTQMRQEAVIGGYTQPRGSRRYLGALLLGVYENRKLIYIGHTGGGFDTAGLAEMSAKLKPLVQEECPFAARPRPNAPVQWVEPRLVCEVKFQEWTADGQMRQPIFLGMRDDKSATAVRREKPTPSGNTTTRRAAQ